MHYSPRYCIFARYLFKMSNFIKYIIVSLLSLFAVSLYAQESDDNTKTVEDDPCNPPVDERFCWKLDPLTGNIYYTVPDTSYIGLCNHDVMESKAMAITYTSNLYGPHLVNQYFSRKEDSDFIFANAYNLFRTAPEDQVFYNTKIPFTVASYSHSGSSVQENDHLFLDFAGNIKPNIGIGTTLDYVYARGEYTGSSAKPLKWNTNLYYQGDQYKAYASFNLSKLANQEWGGITDREYVLHPDKFKETFTQARTMPTKLTDTWNDTDYRNLHFTHSYDLGMWEEVRDEKDTANVWDEFIPVATIFHNFDFQTYKHSFIMNEGSDAQEDKFFKDSFYDLRATNDSTSYLNFSTYAGLRLNEGFNKYSQFGVSAFIGYERQTYTMLVDSLNIDFIERKHVSNSIWFGGQLSRHLSSALTFDITARTALSGDKKGDIDINGQIQTVIPIGRRDPETRHRSDSITVQANGYLRQTTPSYLLSHYFSNHFKWNKDLDQVRKVHVDGLFKYSPSNTSARVGIENIDNFVYFSSEDYLPRQYDKQLQVFSLEIRQGLKFGIIHWDNAILVQTSTDDNVLSLPKISIETDLSLRFKIAKTLSAQFGFTGYYNKKYYAPNYQPATQQFATQNEIECGGFPNVTGYLNCNLKRIKFFVMMTNLLNGATTTDTFIMPDYPMMPRRFAWGISLDLQN